MAFAVDVLRAYARPRHAARSVLSTANTEGKALALVMVGCVFLFFAQLPELMIQDRSATGRPTLVALAAARVIGTLLFAPLLFYLLAGVTGAFIRLLGRRISWLHARVSMFWAVLAASPLVLIEAVAGSLQINGVLQLVVSVVTVTLFAIFWASGLVESARLANN